MSLDTSKIWNDLTKMPDSLVDKVYNWMGEENIRWFSHVKGLNGGINVVLRLNFEKKKIPIHPIHLREGMQIRNFMRSQEECKDWTHEEFEHNWIPVIEQCINKLNSNG